MSNLHGIPKASLGEDLPLISGSRPYSPAFSNLGTIVSPNFFYRRVGSYIHIHGNFTMGTGVAAAAAFALPPGLTINTKELAPGVASSDYNAGKFNCDTAIFSGAMIAYSTDLRNIYFASNSATMVTAYNGSAFTAGTYFALTAALPITQWSLG